MEVFDKKLLFNNIGYLVRKNGIKIGELETQAGVSLGYISRTSKEGNKKPGIDFILNIAQALGVSVDTLLRVNLSALTANENYLVAFLEKLLRDTQEDRLDWQRETEEFLNERFNPIPHGEHPLLSDEDVPLHDKDGNCVRSIMKSIFFSNAFDIHTEIAGDCYNLRLKNNARLYLMVARERCDIVGLVKPLGDLKRELWLCPGNSKPQFLCSTGEADKLGTLIDLLYSAIEETMKHPKVKTEIKAVIDAFMDDDWEDDVNDEQTSRFIPFGGVKSDEDIPF